VVIRPNVSEECAASIFRATELAQVDAEVMRRKKYVGLEDVL
jgi:hypothetical protein